MFIDETRTKTNMTRLYGWAPRGRRLVAKIPHGHWKTATFLAALRNDRIDAPCVFDGPINGERFLAYVEQFLVPTLKRNDIVVLIDQQPIVHRNEQPHCFIGRNAPVFPLIVSPLKSVIGCEPEWINRTPHDADCLRQDAVELLEMPLHHSTVDDHQRLFRTKILLSLQPRERPRSGIEPLPHNRQ